VATWKYELLDTGVFNGDRYFDVFLEVAKQSPEDLLIQISVINRGPEPATLHVLPTLWFRNIWTWWPGTPKPSLKQVSGQKGAQAVAASHADLGERYLYCEGDVPLLSTLLVGQHVEGAREYYEAGLMPPHRSVITSLTHRSGIVY
jgi:hypothetical protein